ncbi:MAG: hypothetical protein JW702_01610 [Clostridiales bacterium]|nr:hypothetical protein [Clostridiales bacterium]
MKQIKKTTVWLLVFVMLASLLSGCSKESSAVEQPAPKEEFSVSEENPSVVYEDAVVSFSPFDMEGEKTIEIEKISPEPLDVGELVEEQYLVSAYDVKLGGQTEFTALLEIALPYDETFIDAGADESLSVIAMYYNEETGKWENVDYRVDTDANEVVITTDHLSTYAVYVVKNENTRLAKIIGINDYIKIVNTGLAEEIVNEAIANQMTPGEKANELGLSIASDWLGLSGAMVTTATQAIYTSELLESIGTGLNGLGLAAAISQAAWDFHTGNDVALYGNLTKNITSLSVGTWGTSAMQLGFVGVYAIDYSLNKFATTAWDGRKDIWYDAYGLYNSTENKKTAKQWYKDFYWMWQDSIGSKTSVELKGMIDASIDSYVHAFWNLPETDQAYYQSEVQNTGSTGGGGLNEALKVEISAAKKAELVKDLQPVFDELEKKISYHLRDEYKKQLINFKNTMNQVVNISIEEKVPDGGKAEFAGYIVKFAPLSDDADEKTWTGKLNDAGAVKTRFTLLGHLQSGSPNTIELYKPDSNLEMDEPDKVIPFKITVPEIIVEIKNAPPLEELVGNWNGALTIEKVVIPPPSVVESVPVDTSNVEGCEDFEIDMNSALQMIKEYEGQVQSKIITIQQIDDVSGIIWIGDADEEITEDQKFNFTYQGGKIYTSLEDAGFTITFDIQASYAPTGILLDGYINVSGMEDQFSMNLHFVSEK